MGNYAPVMEMLDGVISQYQEEFEKANQTVGLNGFIDNYDMNSLLKSNNRAQAALKIRAIVIEAEDEDKGNITRLANQWMNEAIRAGNYSVAHIYENVIKALTMTNPSREID